VSGEPRRVLFVCIGNSCRSQMAEAFARAYGSDVVIPASAGLAPASYIAEDTMRAMLEKSLDLREQFPKSLAYLSRARFDLIVNMSGFELPADLNAKVVDWHVPDPIGVEYKEHCEIRDYIERQVMELILELRRESKEPNWRGLGSVPKQ
jgi:arsenate reductase